MRVLFLGCFILLSCQSAPSGRVISSTESEEMRLDTKFEQFEGGSLESEAKIHGELIDASKQLMEKMRKESKNGVMTRDAHAKSHGCLKAKFTVDNSALPAENRTGLFAGNQSYEAWVRFSNNDHLPIRRDNEFDLRGMAIKVMGVSGRKVMAGQEDAPTQDFLMYGSKVFFVKDNADYVNFIRGLRDDNAKTVLITPQPRAALRTIYAQWKVSGFTNPLNMPYFSAVPIRLGAEDQPERVAVKYGAVPCSKKSLPNPVGKKENDYMRRNLKATLDKMGACYELQVQIQQHPDVMPVEDSTLAWPETIMGYANDPHAPYVTVAKIEIPQQNFDTEIRDRYCENLSFTPWHALVEHKPLGRTMRMRRDLYKATSAFRRGVNHAMSPEPDHFEVD